MMGEITVKCLRCGKRHGLSAYSARISGPIIKVTCPFCKQETMRNLGKFVEKQIRYPQNLGRFELFEAMTSLAREMVKELN